MINISHQEVQIGTKANVTFADITYLQPQEYMDENIWYFLVAMAFVCWGLSVFAPVAEDIFCIATPGLFGLAAWKAPYLTRTVLDNIGIQQVISAVGTTTDNGYNIYQMIIMPQPELQIAMIMLTLLSIVSGIYIIFFRNADKKTEGNYEQEL